MRGFIKYYFIFLYLILFTGISFSQDIKMPHIEAESFYLGEDSTITSVSRSIPPVIFYRPDGYKFEIIMHIFYDSDTIFPDQLIDIIYVLSDGEARKSSINNTNVIRVSLRECYISFQIKLRNNDSVEIFLAQRNNYSETINLRDYKNTSNKIKMFLEHL